ncbi:MAG TPA: tetratricopeptide repeat protein, partial [Candidatus Rifleibacterium sp.]|nr:tetratricopeptide repeat protein [Candidatus Rifleibacterium sp.]
MKFLPKCAPAAVLLFGLLCQPVISGAAEKGPITSKERATALIQEGLDHDSRSLPLLKQLAQLYEWTGSRDLAVNYYQEALEIEPKDKDLKAKISRLRKA